MGILLLNEKSACPRCFCKAVSPYGGHCRNCGVRLFTSPFNWHRYEREEGNREWYLWTKDNGWIHRTHFLDFDCNEVQELTPNDRDRKIPMPEKGYGTKSAQERCAEIGEAIKQKYL